jgi:hypothetical protein
MYVHCLGTLMGQMAMKTSRLRGFASLLSLSRLLALPQPHLLILS